MTGYVYAIENAVGFVKIGWSTDPKRRLSKINSDTSSPCKLLGYVEGTLEQETALHRMLQSEVEHREWFRRGPLLDHFISMLPPPETKKICTRKGGPGRLYDALHARNITPAGLAKAIGRHRVAVSRWNKGRIPAETVRQIEAATGIPASDLRPDLFPSSEGAAA